MVDPILTKLYTLIDYDKGKNPFDFKVIGQRSRSQIGKGQNPCIQPRRDRFDRNLSTFIYLLLMTRERILLILNVIGQRSMLQIRNG